jgi:predicted phosphohydrolase
MTNSEIRTQISEYLNKSLVLLHTNHDFNSAQNEKLGNIYKKTSELQNMIVDFLKLDMSEKTMQETAEIQIAIGDKNSQIINK